MFVRSTSFHAQQAMIDDGIAHLRDTTMPTLTHLDGYLGLSAMTDRDTGRCMISTGWRTREGMAAAAGRVAPLRAEALRVFGATDAEVDLWEAVVLHRAHTARPGTSMRVSWLDLEPAGVTDAIETYKHGIIARIEDLPGFCSAGLFVDRATGRAISSVAYDDRSSLEHSREAADAIRTQASRDMDARIVEVAEFELALAHLHIPELV